MKILAIDSSGLVASAALVEEDRILAEFNVNNKKTHSQTLLPMIDQLKGILGLEMNQIDAVAVSKGPGSFTGLRIGSATAKGIALALEKPIIEISSLEAMAYQCFGAEKLICPIMDARRNQVYTALFSWENDQFKRVWEDAPLPIEELAAGLNALGKDVIFLGDGVPVYEQTLKEILQLSYSKAPAFMNRQRAAALGILALEYAAKGEMVDSDMHRPEYLRLSQAERERLEKNNG